MDHQVFGSVIGKPAVGNFLVTEVFLGFATSFESPYPDVPNHPDDLVIVKSKGEMLSDRLLIWPVSPCERFAYHCDIRPSRGVGFAYVTSRLKGNAHGRK